MRPKRTFSAVHVRQINRLAAVGPLLYFGRCTRPALLSSVTPVMRGGTVQELDRVPVYRPEKASNGMGPCGFRGPSLCQSYRTRVHPCCSIAFVDLSCRTDRRRSPSSAPV